MSCYAFPSLATRESMATKCPKCLSDNPETQKFCGDCGTQLTSGKELDFSVTRTLETPFEDLYRGTLFTDRYEIIEELGVGGMGKVFRVYDKKIEGEVALKLIKPAIASDKKTINRFRNELKLTREISHRNVCRMYDLGESEGTHFITMEYVTGEDLKSFIRRAAPINAARTILIAKQICAGLEEAHRLGVVHRDLKPSNIMIDKEGNARIMDFGIARSLKAEGVTDTGAIIGTPEYMSPEQVEGKDIDHRTDIYSLGVILYEVVTGRVPFEGDTPLSVAHKHKYETPEEPMKLNAQIPADLNNLILMCLEKDKNNRYQSAAEVRSELGQLEKGLPITKEIGPKKKPLTSKEITVTFGLRKLIIPALVFVAVVIIGVIIWRVRPQKEIVAATKITNSVAVISFENQTGDEAYDYLRLAIPSLLVTNLENTGNLYVMTWERMQDLLEQMGKEDLDIIDVDSGFELCQREGIESIVLGSFIKAGDMFATNAKVLNAENKRLLKSVSSRGEGVDSILRTQIDDLSREISIGIGISEQKIQTGDMQTADFTTNSMEAYSYFLKGREDLDKLYDEEARRSLEKAVILDPEFAYAYLLLGRAYSGLGLAKARNEAFEKAKTCSVKATEKEKLYIEAVYANFIERDSKKRFRILKQMAEEYPKEKGVHQELGSYYFKEKLYDQAIEEFNEALGLDPNYGHALNELAFVYVDMEDYEKAIEYFKRYVSVSPGDANALDSMAFCYFSMGRFDEAITKFKDALEVKPDWSHSYWAISYIYALKENYEETIKWIDRAIETAPSPSDRSEGLLFKGFYYFWLGRLDQALGEFRSASVLADSAGNIRLKTFAERGAGEVYSFRGDFELARKSFENFLDYAKNIYPSPLYKVGETELLARADLREDKIDSVKARLDEMKSLLLALTASARASWQSDYNSLLAEVLLAEGSLEEAIAVGKKLSARKIKGGVRFAIVGGINIPLLCDVAARSYLQKGDLDSAIAEYERLITFDPESVDHRLIHPLNHYQLAKLYEEKDWRGKAIEHYEKFLEFWKDANEGLPEVEDAKDRLAALRN